MTFEEALQKLEDMSEMIRDEETSVDEAVKCYEEGMQCYNLCKDLLKKTEQKTENSAKQFLMIILTLPAVCILVAAIIFAIRKKRR